MWTILEHLKRIITLKLQDLIHVYNETLNS